MRCTSRADTMCRLPYPSASPQSKLVAQRAGSLCHTRARSFAHFGACCFGMSPCSHVQEHCLPRRMDLRGTSPYPSASPQSSSACRRLCSPRCTQARSAARFAACCCCMSPCCRARGRRLPLYTEACGRSLRCRPRSKNRRPASLAPAGEPSDRQESHHTSRACRSLHLWCSSM